MAYTFDAGPNAFLFLEDNELSLFATILHANFGSSTTASDFFKGAPIQLSNKSLMKESSSVVEGLTMDENLKGTIQYVINCRVGEGPVSLL